MKKNVLFIWIPKAAGTSIRKALDKYGCPTLTHPKSMYHDSYLSFNNKGFVTFGHVNISYLLKKGIVNREYFDGAFKFCFVRNPWDRLVSLYHYRDYDKNKGKKRLKKMSFEEFVKLVYKKYKKRNSFFAKLINPLYGYPRVFKYLDNFLTLLRLDFLMPLPPVGHYSVRGLSQANSQTDWVFDENGNKLPDFIGRFENLEEDWKKICKKIGIDYVPLSKNNISKKRKNYRDYYSEKTKKIVEEMYKEDIKQFGYRF